MSRSIDYNLYSDHDVGYLDMRVVTVAISTGIWCKKHGKRSIIVILENVIIAQMQKYIPYI